MSNDGFQLEILSQRWMEGCRPEEDLCSHGKILLVVNETVITAGQEDYGISESALALLRTLAMDHTGKEPVADRMVFHGCGTMLMSGCPIGIDWKLRHADDRVHLTNIRRYDSVSESEVKHFPNLQLELPFEEYRQQVIAFAKTAKELFQASEKRIPAGLMQVQYAAFWDEYHSLVERFDDRP